MGFCLAVLLCALRLTAASTVLPESPVVSDSGSWSVEVQLPKNCTPDTQASGYELQSCTKPCDVLGPIDYYLKQGERIQVTFKAKPTLVIVGGSQNLQFLNDLVPDMIVTTAPAPPNPISAVTFTGFSFAPRQKFYNVFKYGTLAKLSIYAFDTSASPGKHTTKGLATYSSAACRTFLDLHLVSVPSNVSLNSSKLYLPPAGVDPAALSYERNRLVKTLWPYIVGGSILLIGLVAACMRIAQWIPPRNEHPEELEIARV